jgi:hypothetical protein
LVGCKTNQKITEKDVIFLPGSNCPDDGTCSFEVLKDAGLEIKSDEFGNLYPEIISGNKLVVKYEYKRKEVENTMDSSYSEFIYFELENLEDHFYLKDLELQKVKLLYGRICFCRNATGYYKITEGALLIDNYNQKLQIKLNFKTPKNIPQIISEIHETITY